MSLVLAMGTLGVGYAMWSDTITIKQTVETGNVEVGVFGVAPDPTEAELKDVASVNVTHGTYKFDKLVSPVPGTALIKAGTHKFYESVTVDISNYYPSLHVLEDFYIGSVGTIPVKLQVTLTVVDPDKIYEHLDISWIKYDISGGNVTAVTSGSGKAYLELPKIKTALEGQQLHECDVVLLYIDKHLQQEAPQGKNASFTLTVKAIQWNKYT